MVDLAQIARTRQAKTSAASTIYRFAQFELDVSKRTLLESGARVRLGSRAISILIALLERPGQLVSKADLVSVAWPQMFVEEGALRVHIAAIRRALRDRSERPQFIASVMGQGYRFVADVDLATAGELRTFAAPSMIRPPQRLHGRDADADTLLQQLRAHRLVTVVGPHGVGKSALAAYVAPGAARIDGRSFARIDLAERTDVADASSLLRQAIAEQRQSALVVLDNCERHLRAAADAVEEALHASPSVSFLVTSNEPLRVTGEHVFFLPPLAGPTRTDLKLEDALTYPAVRLLAERIGEGPAGIAVSGGDVRALVGLALCLDGYPLAIEMAATEAKFLGLQAVLTRMRGKTRPTRAALGRKMQAVIEKHREELAAAERQVLERLAVFCGPFRLDDAIEVCSGPDLSASEIINGLSNLVHRSFVTRSRRGDAIRYRVPAHLRHHFHGSALAGGAEGELRARHARWALAQARVATEALGKLPRVVFMDSHGELADDFGQAVDYALSEAAGAGLAAPLILAAAPTLLCCNRQVVVRAYASRAIRQGVADPVDLVRLKLLEAVIQEDFPQAATGRIAIVEKLAGLLGGIGDSALHAEAFIVEAALHLRRGQLAEGQRNVEAAGRHARAAGDSALERVATRLAAEILHYAADHDGFAKAAGSALAAPATLSPLFGTVTSSPPSAIRVFEARQLWLTGRIGEAVAKVAEARRHAEESNAWAQCEVIALGICPIHFGRGEPERAMAAADDLEAIAAGSDLPHWTSWSAMYRAADHVRQANEGRLATTGPPRLTSFLQAETWATTTASIAGTGLTGEAASPWCAAEVMRLEALALGARGQVDAAVARLMDALTLSRRQGLLIWQLRATMSLARLRQREHAQVRDLIEQVMAQFDDRNATPELIAARSLLAELRHPSVRVHAR